MRTIGLLLLSLGLVASGIARAEQGCSDGFYPGGSQPGGQVCVPIPGYGTSGGGNEQPGERWQNRWGAVAMAPDGKAGAANDAPSKRQAEKIALGHCKSKGGTNCVVEISYRNSCGAVAWGSGKMSAARAGTVTEASNMALQSCSEASSECEIYYSGCSLPERVQ